MLPGLAASLLLAACASAHAQSPAQADFPSRAIRVVVPWNAGTATDTMARTLGQRVSEVTGQPVIIDNRPGAGGVIGSQEVARAAPDGYTMLATSNAHIANLFLMRNVPYDPVRDFVPVVPMIRVALMLVANNALGIRTLAELSERARAAPGKLAFGAGSSGARVGMELYKQMAGVDLLHVPYRSNTLALTDVIGGQVQLMMTDLGLGFPQVKAGKVAGIAVTGTERARSLPDLPTMSEAGLPGYELIGWGGFWVPVNTPAPLVARLNALFGEALGSERSREFIAKASAEPFPLSPAAFAEFQRADLERWRRVTRAAGIEPE